jgi:hypothetical protein
VAKHSGRGSPDLPETGWYCQTCGPPNRESVRLYRTEMLNTHSRQLDPCCRECGAPASSRNEAEVLAQDNAGVLGREVLQ